MAFESDVWCCIRLDSPHLWTVTDHDEFPIGHLRKRTNDQFKLLVGHHASRGQIKVILVFVKREIIGRDGGVNHGCFATIEFVDSLRNKPRVSNEMIDSVGRDTIPHARVVEYLSRDQ